MIPTTAAALDAIRHAAYLVRMYQRPHQLTRRAQAFALMAAAAREALSQPGNDEATLRAIAEGLKPD